MTSACLKAFGLTVLLSAKLCLAAYTHGPAKEVKVHFSDCEAHHSTWASGSPGIYSCKHIEIKELPRFLQHYGFEQGDRFPSEHVLVAPRSLDPGLRPWIDTSSYWNYLKSIYGPLYDTAKQFFLNENVRLLKNITPFRLILGIDLEDQAWLYLTEAYYDQKNVNALEFTGSYYVILQAFHRDQKHERSYELLNRRSQTALYTKGINQTSKIFALDTQTHQTRTSFPIARAVRTFNQIKRSVKTLTPLQKKLQGQSLFWGTFRKGHQSIVAPIINIKADWDNDLKHRIQPQLHDGSQPNHLRAPKSYQGTQTWACWSRFMAHKTLSFDCLSKIKPLLEQKRLACDRGEIKDKDFCFRVQRFLSEQSLYNRIKGRLDANLSVQQGSIPHGNKNISYYFSPDELFIQELNENNDPIYFHAKFKDGILTPILELDRQ